ncbi:PLP-dependent aminotransferase family protein [Streptomyces sp. NPDC058067]|uniref:aminotransferase-like domain-containing protein n=1 Tax=Streptomyces sp. NPDC058067 TaxID=3346324 RepID=UPI0036E0DD10
MLAAVELDRGSVRPLHLQLYRRLRGLILDGTLPPETRLPSTRTLVAELGVSRLTVSPRSSNSRPRGSCVHAGGDGTYVDVLLRAAMAPAPVARPQLSERGAATSARGASLFSEAPHSWDPKDTESFIPSQVAASAFPAGVWRRLLARHAARTDAAAIGYGDPRGYEPLRQAIADNLNEVRGLGCSAEQIVVTSGSQQAFTVLAVLLLDPVDTVLVEDPGHISGRLAFQSQGCHVQGVPVDDAGAVTAGGAASARLACLTPSRQHPLGTVMSPARRGEWIAWARAHGGWIVEDDCDSELRSHGKLLPPLFGLDQWQQPVVRAEATVSNLAIQARK